MKYIIFFFMILLVGCSTEMEVVDVESTENQVPKEQIEVPPMPPSDEGEMKDTIISKEELGLHSTSDDCWIVYEGHVYDYSNAARHPSMDKVFFSYCGKVEGFESGAKAKHASSSVERVEGYGPFVGIFIE